MSKLTDVKGVIFDYGGTIDTNSRHWAEVLWSKYEEFQVPVDKASFREAYVHGELIHPKRDYREADKAFFPKPYYQVFDQKLGFLPNLSVIDLLFNMGPESLLVLRDSVRAFNEI